MDRPAKINLIKVLIDLTCLAIVGFAVLGLFLFGKPYQRGFFCDDESLYYRLEESTVTVPMLYLVGMFLPMFTMIAGEYAHWRNLCRRSSSTVAAQIASSWIAMAYSKIGLFCFGVATTALTTDIAKYTIGRLRPHFMNVCVPNVDCGLPENQHRYIENFTCTASGVSSRSLKELRLSFPSGHSSFSAYTMVWLALYLQLRVTWKGSRLLKHFLQFGCLMMAWFTGMSRVSDYKHHWSDVLAGMSLGTIVALITVFCVADLFEERRASFEAELKRESVEIEAQNGTRVNNGSADRIV